MTLSVSEGRPCDGCGFSYAYANNVERLHRKRHDQWQHGVPVQSGGGKKGVIPLGCPLGMVHVVTPDAPMTWRQIAETMARFGRPESHLDRPMYNARGAREGERTALLGVQDGRARALLVIGPSDATKRYAYTWADLDAGKHDPTVTDRNSPPGGWWTVWFAWTVKEHRRRGWAHELAQVASTWTGILASEFLWETPFSDAGEGLVRKIAVERFWRNP